MDASVTKYLGPQNPTDHPLPFHFTQSDMIDQFSSNFSKHFGGSMSMSVSNGGLFTTPPNFWQDDSLRPPKQWLVVYHFDSVSYFESWSLWLRDMTWLPRIVLGFNSLIKGRGRRQPHHLHVLTALLAFFSSFPFYTTLPHFLFVLGPSAALLLGLPGLRFQLLQQRTLSVSFYIRQKSVAF